MCVRPSQARFAYPVMGGGMGNLANERGYALAEAMSKIPACRG